VRSTISIRHLEPSDLDAAFGLSSTAGWNQRLDDWRMLMRIAPAGCFAAIVDNQIIGTAIGIDYHAFGWIAMMLVEPEFRGQGIGARLLEAAMAGLPPDLPIRLDATPLGRQLYQRYGFEDETMLTRHVVAATASRLRIELSVSLDEHARNVRSLSDSDLPAVVRSDTAVFAGTRDEVIGWMLKQSPDLAWTTSASANAADYCLGRRGRLFDQIGPVVANDHDVARVLLASALRAAGGRAVMIDAFNSRKTFVGWLAACGFEAERPLYRMCRPGRLPFNVNDHRAEGLSAFAILGPEFA
jgi:GNAT superfamily N-acetyltransferase